MKFRPLNDKILIELAPIETVSNGGIIFTDNRQKRPQWGIVIAIGPKVKDVSVGDKIQFAHGAFQPLKNYDFGDQTKDYALVEEKVVIGIFQK